MRDGEQRAALAAAAGGGRGQVAGVAAGAGGVGRAGLRGPETRTGSAWCWARWPPAEPERGNQVAVIDVALGDDAVERRGHALIGLQRDDAAQVGLEGVDVARGGADVGLLGVVVGLPLVAFLAGKDAACDERLVAVVGDPGQGELRFLLVELRVGLADLLARLVYLLVEVGASMMASSWPLRTWSPISTKRAFR